MIYEILLKKENAGRVAIAQDFDKSYQGDIERRNPRETYNQILSRIFQTFNRDIPADYPHRSLSNGDVVIIDRQIFQCRPIGWSKLQQL